MYSILTTNAYRNTFYKTIISVDKTNCTRCVSIFQRILHLKRRFSSISLYEKIQPLRTLRPPIASLRRQRRSSWLQSFKRNFEPCHAQRTKSTLLIVGCCDTHFVCKLLNTYFRNDPWSKVLHFYILFPFYPSVITPYSIFTFYKLFCNLCNFFANSIMQLKFILCSYPYSIVNNKHILDVSYISLKMNFTYFIYYSMRCCPNSSKCSSIVWYFIFIISNKFRITINKFLFCCNFDFKWDQIFYY